MATATQLVQSLLSTSIGNNRNSSEDDVRTTRKKLKTLNYEAGNEDFGYIDKPLNDAIRKFQQDHSLKSDGIITPHGETEQMITGRLAQKSASDSSSSKEPKVILEDGIDIEEAKEIGKAVIDAVKTGLTFTTRGLYKFLFKHSAEQLDEILKGPKEPSA